MTRRSAAYCTEPRYPTGPTRSSRKGWSHQPRAERVAGAAISARLPLAPFLVFDGLFFDRVELVEAHQALDVVPRGDAFVRAEAGKVPGRLQLLERALVEMKGDQ